MKKLLLIGTCGLALGAAGCGSDDESDTTAADTGTGTAAAGGGVTEVVIKDTAYNPKNVSVKKGDTISWKNEDSFDHTVTKRKGPGAKFDSGNVAAGETFEQGFTTTGKIDYHCTIHPQQTGTITVK